MRKFIVNRDALIEKNLIENYERYYRLAYSYVRNEPDAMDIVQEAACKAIYKSSTLEKPECIRKWLCRIVINEAYNILRKKQKEISTDDLWEPDGSGGGNCEDIVLQEAIHQLKKEEQTIIYLRYYEDKQLEEIAEITSENLNTVKSRLYRAMNKLKLALEDQSL